MTLDREVYANRKKVDFYKINDNINNNNNTYNTCLISMTFVAIPPAVAQTPQMTLSWQWEIRHGL